MLILTDLATLILTVLLHVGMIFLIYNVYFMQAVGHCLGFLIDNHWNQVVTWDVKKNRKEILSVNLDMQTIFMCFWKDSFSHR